MKRYTRDEVLELLRWQVKTSPIPRHEIEPDQTVLDWCGLSLVMRPWQFRALEDALDGMCELFGVAWDDLEAVKQLEPNARSGRQRRLRLARITFGDLADYLAARAVKISFEPIEIAGQSCATAGAFRGLEEVAQRMWFGKLHFAPSTPLLRHYGVLRLGRFWQRLRFFTAGRVPALNDNASNLYLIGTLMSLFVVWMALILGWSLENRAILFGGLACGGISAATLARKLTKTDPLPPGIVTFADLARTLTESPTNQLPLSASATPR